MLLGAVGLFAVCAFSTEISDTDFWWHLRTGQFVGEEMALPAPDPFSYTAEESGEAYEGEAGVRYFNLTHEWLAQMLAYWAYAAGGVGALVLLRAMVLSIVCLAGCWLAWRETGHLLPAAFAGVAPVPVMLLFAADRPAVLSFALVAVFVVVLEEHWRRPGRAIWLLPALQWAWMNSHGGAFLGWVVLGIYAVAALGKPASFRNSFWWVAGVAGLVSFLNPNGYAHLSILLAYRESFLTKTLIEWRPPYLWGPPYLYNVLLYSCAAVMALSWRRLAMRHLLLFMAFGAASVLAFRNLPFLAFVAAYLLVVYGWIHVAGWVERLPAGLQTAAPALLLLICLGWRATAAPPALRFGVADWRFPEKAAGLLATIPTDAPLFNTYELGGYLLWRLGPERKVFIDGRALSEHVYADYRRMVFGDGRDAAASAEQRAELLKKYGVRVIAMNGIEFVTGRIYPMLLALADPEDTSWQLLYADEAAVVFVQNRFANRSILEQHPPLDKGKVLDHLEQACRANIAHDPELFLCARSVGQLFARLGQKERAVAALDLYLRQVGADPAMEQMRNELAQ